ncbi:hypothetical protein G9C98_000302 [Cotesia typhae]|uniref:Centrosome-associated FAM110 C-terminal domain-containing protein n=1 Tax=Cotesia typhae TaxID=2053667 RepID=A0A8J5US30_9HYME|nr:hypothetical protein G9C98_000302 [Cotesia typhae]
MMTAMARLPCKTSGSNEYQQHHQRQSSASGNLFAGNTARTNFWDIQTRQSNPTYVRSQHRQIDHTVLDRKQELKNSGHLQVAASTAAGAPPRLLRKCNTLTCNIPSQGSSQSATSGPCCWSNCQDNVLLSPQRTLPPALPPKSPRLICSLPQRRAISGPPSSNGGDQLQTKLRRLLVNTDSKENIFFSSDNPTLLSPIGHEHSNTLDVRLKFGRSNSHSSGKTTQRKLNISPPADTTCHKSLPDLHTSVRRRSSLVLSSGGRTQKSSGSSKLSHGANARDSGGSSGHCTHRSEPPPRIQDCWSHVRRDSGASTQHSNEHPQNRNRPILRSKSDISDRYYRENPLLHQRKPRMNPPRSLTELENFFNRLGLDTENYEQITVPGSNASSPVFFDSVSSVDSALGLHPWTGNNQSSNGTGQNWPGGGNATNCLTAQDDTSQRISDPPSIVERNARIIKWLCQCRKVQFGYT